MALYTVNTASVVNAADINQFTNLLNGTTTGTSVVVASRIRAQSTGAAVGSGGYVGQTASNAPTSGSFLQGDIVVDGSLGVTWVCTASGTPGSWTTHPVLIAEQTLGASTASITFSSIPAFRHISVYWQARTTSTNASDNMQLRFNGDTGNNYDWQLLSGLNATASTTPGLGDTKILAGTVVGGTGTANFYSTGTFDVAGFSQASATHILTVSGKWYACWSNSAATSQVGLFGGLYTPAAAVTSLTLFPAAGNFAAGSIFSLYGYM